MERVQAIFEEPVSDNLIDRIENIQMCFFPKISDLCSLITQERTLHKQNYRHRGRLGSYNIRNQSRF